MKGSTISGYVAECAFRSCHSLVPFFGIMLPESLLPPINPLPTAMCGTESKSPVFPHEFVTAFLSLRFTCAI